ncbi:MAG: glycoside hydrolase family 5 protein [Rhizobiaceae bacterium]|nr:glycoside hydrolase family 5 protein [Rhizobiaceae bacterium]
MPEQDRMTLMAASIKKTLLALAFGLACLTAADAATFSVKRGINLDNWVTWPSEDKWGDPAVILPFPEWRRSLGTDGLRALRQSGLDFVRMPIDPAPLLSPTAAPLQSQLLDSMLESVKLANAAGLKVIVDLHTLPWGDDRTLSTGRLMEDDALFDRYVELVRTVAARLAYEDPTQVAFEPINEPTADCQAGDKVWPDRLKRLFAASRASATRLTLILQGSCWSSAEGLTRIDPSDFPDDNLIWTFHSYAPFLLTHQGASWAGDFIRYVTGLPYPPAVDDQDAADTLERIRATIRREAPLLRRDAMIAYLDEQFAEIDTPEKIRAVMARDFDTVEEWARQHGVAADDILLGEFGMIRQEYAHPFVMNPQWRAAYSRDMIELAEKHGFAWSIWSYGGAFGVVEAFDNQPAEPDVMDMIRSLR